jgi:hypothetical protein
MQVNRFRSDSQRPGGFRKHDDQSKKNKKGGFDRHGSNEEQMV